MTTFLDAAGVCIFVGPQPGPLCSVCEIMSAHLGESWDLERALEMGRSVISAEEDFNRRAGLPTGADRLPDFLYTEPLPPRGVVFDVEFGEPG